MGRRGDTDRLAAVLSHHDRAIDRDGRMVDLATVYRIQAVRVLADLPGPPALELLARAALDEDAQVRRAAAKALGARTAEAAAAADALAFAITRWPEGDAGGLGAAERALRGLQAPDRATALAEHILETAPGGPAFDVLFADLLADGADDGESTRIIEQLVEALGAEDEDRREQAGRLLGTLGPEPVPNLLAALRDEGRRPAVAIALGRTQDRRATPALVEALSDPEVGVRRAAAAALEGLADPRSIEALLHATDDDDYEVRRTAIDAVDRLGSVAVIVGVAASLRAQFQNPVDGVVPLEEVVRSSLSAPEGDREPDSTALVRQAPRARPQPPAQSKAGAIQRLQSRLRRSAS